MAGYQRCISLALVCLWLCHHSLAFNSEPCKPNNNAYDAYNAFLMKHVPAATPRTCAATKGGRRYTTNGILDQTNLCISKKRFNYFTVRYDKSNNEPVTIEYEKKHLILGCDIVGDKCLPVHFEPNDD
ncbi:unnamed protein product [Lota lota]